ncbi:small redox-active disulfide protein 2 [Sulfuritortus calidifontis]|uniref:Small redox-active disulfide protein 2 n=1 Tax=Sulfuritortus calidifontis TaxID=1914471 RepID=A0A4R3JX89_9PROT|nr:MTH895/ArsE family thioredoxin-like protein [Sulfuritortus calidifontis]TCS71740.1 small redox-active disulfide protein 2 [Sulfuritortus calidifontis]
MATLDIEWRHLVAHGNTCARCDDTGSALRQTLARLAAELAAAGIDVQFRETALGPEQLPESNLVLIDGRPLEDWLGARATETHCASCCELVGEAVCCRAIELNGTIYEAIPEALIRDAARAALAMKGHPMKDIKVLGSGCANCETTAKLIQDVAKTKGVEVSVEKVTDMGAILSYGVMSTPGVVIDGKVVHAGGVPDRKKIEGWLG